MGLCLMIDLCPYSPGKFENGRFLESNLKIDG